MGLLVAVSACGLSEQAGPGEPGSGPADRAVILETIGCGYASGRTGSGVALGNGLVITVAHLIVEAESVNATVSDQTHHGVVVAAIDRRIDLALLRVPAAQPPEIELASLEKGGRGRIVGASASGTVPFEVRGVVELTIEEVFGTTRYARQGYELAASTSDGDSGAGAYDDRDRLIGIVFATGQDGATTWVTASSEMQAFLASVGTDDTQALCE